MRGTLFSNNEFKPYESAWSSRLKELKRRRGYYDGSAYAHIKEVPIYGPRLYKGIKPLYLPLSRAVDVDAGLIPGDWLFTEDAPAAWESARELLFNMSNWNTRGVLYVHYGAEYGVVGLKVSNITGDNKIVVAPLEPTTFMLINGGDYSDAPKMAIMIMEAYDSGASYEYAEVIEPGRVRTYRDGEPYGYGDRPADYESGLDYVPIVEVRHIETGDALGECTYQKAIPMLNEVNELASYLADIIKRHIEPQWAVVGGEPGDLLKSGDSVWFLPGASDAKALVAAVDIGGTLSFIQDIHTEVKASLPELAFEDLKSKTQIATATLELQLMELVIKINRTRPNYDAGLVRALQMAGAMGGEFNVAGLAPLADDSLEIDAGRPVLPLDPVTKLEIKARELAIAQAAQALELGDALAIREGG